MTAAKSTRVTNVQVPGDAPAANLEASGDGAGNNSTSTTSASDEDAFAAASTAPSDPVDLEALRAQIREEERANARAELGQQIQAASTALEGSVSGIAQRHGKADYSQMRASDIDHTTLTAPVLTRDGYLCPPAPEAKK